MLVTPLVLISVAAALVAGAAMLGIGHGGAVTAVTLRRSWPALLAASAAVGVTAGAGLATGAAPVGFLISLAAFTLPVLMALDAAAAASGARNPGRGLLLGVWAVVVFPAATLAPLLLGRGCSSPDCRVDDFGGALPLVVSGAAFVLLAMLPSRDRVAGSSPPDDVTARGSGRRADPRSILAVLAFWLAFAVWLASLEGAADEYVPRILLHVLVVPVAAALGWTLVDRLRGVHRPVTRSLLLGLLAGLVAAMPGPVSVGLPWAPVAGALAGALGALVFARSTADPRTVPARWALSLLLTALVGLLAPAISGDQVGVIFTARFTGLASPLLAFGGTAVGAAVAAVPVWLVIRRQRVAPASKSRGGAA